MKRFIVWIDYGHEGWQPYDADTFDEAIALWKNKGGLSCEEAVVTENIPIVITDGREKGGDA